MIPDSGADDLGLQSVEALRRRAAASEARLRESQALLASVLESSLTGLMVFQAVRNVAGEIVDFEWLLVNPAGLRATGRPRCTRCPRGLTVTPWRGGSSPRCARPWRLGGPRWRCGTSDTPHSSRR